MTRSVNFGMKLCCLGLFFGLAAGGCHPPDDADAFRNGVPRYETVAMNVPQSGGAVGRTAAVVVSHLASTQGKTADFYGLTRAVSGVVNGGAFWVLSLVRTISHYPPTTLEKDVATWGPWGGGLEPVEWMMKVTRVGEHDYQYALSGRPKGTQDTFLVVLSGRHKATVGPTGQPMEGFGEGHFLLDWDERAKLPMPGKEVGKARYTYAHKTPGGPVNVAAKFDGVQDDERPGQRVNLDYVYGTEPSQGGTMEFAYNVPMSMKDKVGDRWVVKSRWTAVGAGRADVKAASAKLPVGIPEVRASECWDASFASVFFQVSWDPRAGYGAESACAFSPASYSNL